MHVQIILWVARNVASHENNHGTSDERADKQKPEPNPETFLFKGAVCVVVGAEGSVDKDCDDAKDFDDADKRSQNTVQVSDIFLIDA